MIYLEPTELHAVTTPELRAARNDADTLRRRITGLFYLRVMAIEKSKTDHDRAEYYEATLKLLPGPEGLPAWFYELLDEAFQELGYLGLTLAECYNRDTATATAYNTLSATVNAIDVELEKRADEPAPKPVIAFSIPTTQGIQPDNRMW